MRPDPGMIGRARRPGCGGLRTGHRGDRQVMSMDLLLNAVVLGVLLGCFYAAVSLGLSVSFGLLDVPHVAHPAFLILASYGVFFLNDSYDIDPLLAGLMIPPLLFFFGPLAPPVFYENFQKRRPHPAAPGPALP